MEERAAESEAEIWADNMPVVEAFLAAASQWRTAGGGFGPLVWLGLDYAGAVAGIAAAGIVLTPELWSGVRMMEGAARDALNAKRP